ncbi:hypothetical protein [Parasediminibacterium sp. JCM 36343]|uniref:hypothetical protein n=1 Tax=Parasediminibacterium sp. JCM 36343 TaxID=3374279 RepID=UPI00397D2F0B
MEALKKASLTKKLIVFASILVFIISLTQDAFKTDYYENIKGEGTPAFLLLLIGWLDFGKAGTSWLANPLLLYSWVMLFKKPLFSTIAAFLSVLFSASFLLFSKIAANESVTYANITSRELGYWLWLTSCGIMSLGTIFIYFNKRQKVSLITKHDLVE